MDWGYDNVTNVNSQANGTDDGLAIKYYHDAIKRLTSNAHTDECKRKIMDAYHDYLKALSHENYYPFERTMYHTQCPNKEPANPVCCIDD